MSLKSPEFARLKTLGFEILSQIEPTIPEEKGTTQTAIRLDEEILAYFQGEAYDSKFPNNYQARINGVLVRYIQIKNASDDLAKEVAIRFEGLIDKEARLRNKHIWTILETLRYKEGSMKAKVRVGIRFSTSIVDHFKKPRKGGGSLE